MDVRDKVIVWFCIRIHRISSCSLNVTALVNVNSDSGYSTNDYTSRKCLDCGPSGENLQSTNVCTKKKQKRKKKSTNQKWKTTKTAANLSMCQPVKWGKNEEWQIWRQIDDNELHLSETLSICWVDFFPLFGRYLTMTSLFPFCFPLFAFPRLYSKKKTKNKIEKRKITPQIQRIQ